MRRIHLASGVLVAALSGIVGMAAGAEVPTLDAFFAGAQIRSVSISPNGQSLAMIVTADGKNFVAVKERNSATPATPILAPNERDGFDPGWCHWANDERVVCSFHGREHHKALAKIFPVTRLVSVNKDGSKQKMLLQDQFQPSGQINDRIIDWTPESPRTVLIEKFNPQIGLRVLELDVYSGGASPYEQPHQYIGRFGTDGHGNVRLGWGQLDMKVYYHARLQGETKWRRLGRVGVFDRGEDRRGERRDGEHEPDPQHDHAGEHA